jgi:hypothetical protein
MKPINEYNILRTLNAMISEQAEKKTLETDNAPSAAKESPFTPAEERFLGKFDAYGSTHLGILYSVSDIGIREFISRSGKDLNVTPEILIGLIKNGIVKIVPYTGFGRNTDYTLELQLSLDDVKGLGAEDKKDAESQPAGGGAPPADMGGSTPPPPPPGPPTEWVMGYGDLLTESSLITYQLLSEKKHSAEIHTKQSRILKDMPRTFITHLNNIIDSFSKKKRTVSEKQRLIADILDNLMVNFDLDAKQIRRSFEMHREQKKLKKILDSK